MNKHLIQAASQVRFVSDYVILAVLAKQIIVFISRETQMEAT